MRPPRQLTSPGVAPSARPGPLGACPPNGGQKERHSVNLHCNCGKTCQKRPNGGQTRQRRTHYVRRWDCRICTEPLSPTAGRHFPKVPCLGEMVPNGPPRVVQSPMDHSRGPIRSRHPQGGHAQESDRVVGSSPRTIPNAQGEPTVYRPVPDSGAVQIPQSSLDLNVQVRGTGTEACERGARTHALRWKELRGRQDRSRSAVRPR